ncbi:MAG: hypothetical protein ACRDQA_29110, partial [Nocardioidaceae bacterium]
MTDGRGGQQTSRANPELVVRIEGSVPARSEVLWAAEESVRTFREAGLAAERSESDAVPPGARSILMRDNGRWEDADPATESFTFERPGGMGGPVLIAGGPRGLVYGLLELADRVACAPDEGAARQALDAVGPMVQRPATPVRSILRAFACEVEDKPWFHDRRFWTEYLTELATQRINRFQLALGMQYNYPHHPATDNYFCFPYPFLLGVPGYDVRAGGLPAVEREENLEMLRFISDEAARRGLRFQLGLWNHAYDQGEGSRPHYPISGLTAHTHAAYCAAALARLLRECPSIGGLTLRVHYEGGVPEPEHGPFWREVLGGVAGIGRPIELDLHAKGVDQELLDIARGTGMPVVLGAKYWAEHQGLPYHQTAIREKEKATATPGTGVMAITAHQRRFTRYGYGDFLKEDRDYGVLFRVWPGTQRVLLWGDPELAAGYGRLGTLGDALGVELSEPLTFSGRMDSGTEGGRDPYVDPELRLDRDIWKKYRYTTRLWGRLLYDPEADPDGWRRFLRSEFGSAAPFVETALGAASRVLPLVTVVHGIGASNNGYWPEVYLNMPIAGGPNGDHYERDTAQPPTFGGVSPFDPQLFYRIDEYADDLLAGRRDGRYTPADTAQWLVDLADRAEEGLRRATVRVSDPGSPGYRRVAVDIAVQAGLARFFAGKTSAGLAYALFERTKDPARLDEAVAAYRAAKVAFAEVARATTGVYRDDLAFGVRASEHGHWASRLPDIEADLADLELRRAELAPSPPDTKTPVPELASADRPPFHHVPPGYFDRGADLIVDATLPNPEEIDELQLDYRRLNQGEDYQRLTMIREGDRYHGTIPAAYTDSPYPLAYYFTVHHVTRNAWLLPGLAANLANQPYYIVRQAGHKTPRIPGEIHNE